MKEISLTHGKITLVDDEDYPFLNQWNWIISHNGEGYAICQVWNKDKMTFTEYFDAHDYAVSKARALNMCYGIEKMNQFGKQVFSVKMIPTNPQKRFGWELRCEVVTPESPFYKYQESANE